MKKMFSMLAASLLIFSGCTMPFSSEKVETIPADQADKMATENPEELFNTLVKANQNANYETLKQYLPARDVLEKNTSNFVMKGNGSLDNTPLGGGDLDFSLEFNGKTDISNQEDPKMELQMIGSFDAMGGLVKGKAKGMMKVVNTSVFGTLEEFSMNNPLTGDLGAIAESFMGKWYGNTFAEINEMTGGNEINIEKLFSGSLIISMMDVMEKINENPQEYIQYQSYVKSENGYHYFTATVNEKTYELIFDAILSQMPIGGEEIEDARNQMLEEVKKAAEQPMTIALTPANPKYSITSSVAMDMDTGEVLEGKNSTMSYTEEGIKFDIPLTATDSMTFEKTGDTFSLTTTLEGATLTPLKGMVNETQMSFEVFDVYAGAENPAKMAEGNFTKSADAWSGEISSPAVPVKLSVLSYSYTPEKIAMKAEGFFQEEKVGTMEMMYTLKGESSVDVSAPESSESFEVMMNELNTSAGNTTEFNDDLADEEPMTDEELEALIKELETAEEPLNDEDVTTPEEKRQAAKTESDTTQGNTEDPLTGLLTGDTPPSDTEFTPEDVVSALDEMFTLQQKDPSTLTEEDQMKMMETLTKLDAIANSGQFTEDELTSITTKYMEDNNITPPVQ